MEPGDRPAQEVTSPAPATIDSSSSFTLRLLAGCAVLIGLACVQDAGLLIADTKFDLVLDPGGFLERSLHLWDPAGALGQLQNQAYGYLWPMGPFFVLGHWIALPAWLVQRLWMGLVLSVAFVGAAALIRRLGVRSDVAAIVAGFAYALSPRMLSLIGESSIELWPSAIAPWVLLPLVIGSQQGSPRRAAALAALAVAMVGGVNAAATLAVLPMGVIWLLTREKGPRRRSLMLWWPLFTALGTLWWLVPLFTLGAYSPPFLDYIESASVTTVPTNLFDALRGTSNWVAYVTDGYRAGQDLITTFIGPMNSAMLMLLGAVGLGLRRNPHRQFLVLSLLTGLVLVSLGHLGEVSGWGAQQLHDALDGALKPLRNVHKYDPIIRLPLVIGLAYCLDAVWTAVPGRARQRGERLNRVAFTGLTIVVLLGSVFPAYIGRLAPSNPVFGVPDYWHQTADWLADHSGQESAMLVPGSSFATYVWGSPQDEPLQALARSRWTVRNAIPLTPPGNIRMLDAAQEQILNGRGSAGLAPYLARAGIEHLVVRNDLQPNSDLPSPARVHAALAQSPGIERVASFGPVVGGEPELERDDGRVVINGGAQSRWPAVEIFAVTGAHAAVQAAESPVVAGGPEDLLDLGDLGVVGDAPTRLATDLSEKPAEDDRVVLTDGLRTRERFFGRINDSASSVWTPGDRRRSGNPVRDYLPAGAERWSTTATLSGAEAIEASSSMSDSTEPGGAHPARLPYAAIDGDPATSWVSGSLHSGQAWWQVDLGEARAVPEVTVRMAQDSERRQRVRVVTDAETSEPETLQGGDAHTFTLNDRATRTVRVESVSDVAGTQIEVAEVEIPGVEVRRTLALPHLPEAWPTPESIVMRRLQDGRTGCLQIERRVPCVASWQREDEEQVMRRSVRLPRAASLQAQIRVRPLPGPGLTDLIQGDQPIQATASSTGVDDLRGSALAAVDADPATAWTAAVGDYRPTLSLNWLGKRPISGLTLTVDRAAPVRQPTRLLLRWPGGRREVTLKDGRVELSRPIRTDQLSVGVLRSEDTQSVGFDQLVTRLPVGISEIRLDGLGLLPLVPSAAPRLTACGTGPTIEINGRAMQTRVRVAPADLRDDESMAAEVCGSDQAALAAGDNTVTATPGTAFTVDSVVLRDPDAPTPAESGVSAVTQSSVERRVNLFDAGAGDVVAVRENANRGWQATQNGSALDRVTLDGWQQGWRVRGDDPVTMRFGADTPYRIGLLIGLLGFVSLLVLVAWSRRWRSGRETPAIGAAPLPVLALAAVGALVAGLLGGTLGVLLVAVGAGVHLLVRRRQPDLAPWATAPLIFVAAFAWIVGPWGSVNGWGGSQAWPIYCVLVALGGVVAGALDERLPRFLKRMRGSSRKR